MEERRKALAITWAANEQNTFWNLYEKDIHPTIEELHKNNSITQVLPFHNKPLYFKDNSLKWTNCVIVMLANEQVSIEIQSSLLYAIENSPLNENFCAMDLLQLQKGLDVFFPVNNGISRAPRMKQTIAYLFSNPKARKEYYED